MTVVEPQKHRDGTTSLWTLRSVRLQMALLCAFAMTIHGVARASIGMALVCMVRPQTAFPVAASSETNRTAAIVVDSRQEHNTDFQVDWDSQAINLVHTAYHVGTVFSVLCAHTVSQRAGAKSAIAASVGVTTLVMCLTPAALFVWPSAWVMIGLRAITGLAQGLVTPCASLLIAKWFAESEKSTAMAIFTTGNQVGISAAMYATAEMCKVPWLGGWPISFLAYGVYGTLFLALWLPLATSRPRQSLRISVTELKHIDGVGQRSRAVSVVPRTPYRKLIFSPATMAICACSFSQTYLLVTIVSYLPAFYKSVLALNLTSNGLWSSLPFAIQMATKILFAFLADSMKRHGCSANCVTKLFNGVASFGSAGCLLAVSAARDASPALLIALLCATLGLNSGYVAGYNTSLVCVAPSFTAFVSSYAQGFSILAGVVALIITGYFINEGNMQSWNSVFNVMVAVLLISGLIFQFFGSADIQPWARPMLSLSTTAATAEAQSTLLVEPTRPTKKGQRVSIMDEDGLIYPAGIMPQGKLAEENEVKGDETGFH